MLYNDAPFELGETLDGTAADGTTLINDHWLGAVFEIPAQALSGAQVRAGKKRHVARPLKAVIMRNTSGGVLLGKRLGKLDVSATNSAYDFFKNVTGYATDLAESNVVIIDEFLPSAGVADDDIFWAIIEGPVTVKTCNASLLTTAIGDKLGSGTGSTSGNTVSGGVNKIAAPTADDLIGTALSARTTNETGEDMLINATIKLW